MSKAAKADWRKMENLKIGYGVWESWQVYKRWGAPEWIKPYYLRAHTEEVISKLSELGINCILTHFFRGLGLKYESEEIELTRKMIELCHSHGIKVLTYIQCGPFFYEALFSEVPESKNWAAIDQHGCPVRLPKHYFRYFSCLNQPGWLEYLKKCVDLALKDLSADGIFFDNPLIRYCQCEKCRMDFVSFLIQNANTTGSFFDKDDFSSVEPPYTCHWNSGPIDLADPLSKAWRDFTYQVQLSFNSNLCSYTRSVKKDALICGNQQIWIEEAPGSSKNFDMTFLETEWCPRMKDGKLYTQLPWLKRGEALDIRTLCMAYIWDEPEHDAWYYPTPKGDQIGRILAEEFLCKNTPIYCQWAMLPTNRSDRCAFEDPAVNVEMRKWFDFYDKNKSCFIKSHSIVNIAVLHSDDSFSFGRNITKYETRYMQYWLHRNHLDYDIVFPEDLESEKMIKYKVLVLADAVSLSDREIQKIEDFVRSGGAIVATGRTSLYNENFEERANFSLSEIFGMSYDEIVRGKSSETTVYGKGKAIMFYSSAGTLEKAIEQNPELFPYHRGEYDQVFNAIREILGNDLILKTDAPNTIVTTVYKLDNGNIALNIINYDDKDSAGEIKFSLPKNTFSKKKLKLVDLETPCSDNKYIETTENRNRVEFVIPKPTVFCLVLAEKVSPDTAQSDATA